MIGEALLLKLQRRVFLVHVREVVTQLRNERFEFLARHRVVARTRVGLIMELPGDEPRQGPWLWRHRPSAIA